MDSPLVKKFRPPPSFLTTSVFSDKDFLHFDFWIQISVSVIDEMQKSPIEKRKRNLKTISPHSRGEREIWIPFHQFWEEKEKSESLCLVSRGEREISNFLAQVREEKEKPEFISPVSRGEREISNSFAQFREEKEKLANISNFREEKFKTKFLYGYIHLRE